jgi:hypothetical protein
LSQSTNPCVGIFLRYSLKNYLPRLALNGDPPDFCLLE